MQHQLILDSAAIHTATAVWQPSFKGWWRVRAMEASEAAAASGAVNHATMLRDADGSPARLSPPSIRRSQTGTMAAEVGRVLGTPEGVSPLPMAPVPMFSLNGEPPSDHDSDGELPRFSGDGSSADASATPRSQPLSVGDSKVDASVTSSDHADDEGPTSMDGECMIIVTHPASSRSLRLWVDPSVATVGDISGFVAVTIGVPADLLSLFWNRAMLVDATALLSQFDIVPFAEKPADFGMFKASFATNSSDRPAPVRFVDGPTFEPLPYDYTVDDAGGVCMCLPSCAPAVCLWCVPVRPYNAQLTPSSMLPSPTACDGTRD